MALAAAGFFEDLPRGQVQITEVIGEKDTRKKSGRARSAPHPERYFVIQRKVKSRSENAANSKHVEIGGKNEIVFQLRAKVGVAARGVDAEILSNRSVDG